MTSFIAFLLGCLSTAVALSVGVLLGYRLAMKSAVNVLHQANKEVGDVDVVFGDGSKVKVVPSEKIKPKVQGKVFNSSEAERAGKEKTKEEAQKNELPHPVKPTSNMGSPPDYK